MKFPKGINDANANATPPTAKSLKKSRLDKELFLAEPCSDIFYNMRFFPINDATQIDGKFSSFPKNNFKS
jgi:hypothetical protein